MLLFIGKMLEKLGTAAATKAKQKTIGKAEAKIQGAQQAAQQKALRGMDKQMSKVENKAMAGAKGMKMPGGGGGAEAAPPGAYQPVNAGYAPMPQGGGAMAGQLMCPNGHPLDPSWEVCPYCRSAAQQGVKAVQVQPGGGGAAQGATMAVNIGEVLGTDHVAKAVVGWLVCMKGPQKGADFRLYDGKNVMGTAADADIVVYDQFVSAKHAVILVESAKAKYAIQDLESRNKTFVNREQVIKQDLVDNDEIRIGQVEFRFKALY